ncbi:polysaccharide biosynthesis protein [Candidatus Pseudothioglobus singularis]|nr:polysaccharide biosynthesis protein [Candidatus Pseudothioglobus singularis]
MLFVDSVLLVSVILLSFSIRLGYFYLPEGVLVYWVVYGAPIVAAPIFVRFGLYRVVIRYISFNELWSIVQAVTLYALLWSMISFMVSVDGIPRSVILINWLLGIATIGGSRLVMRWLLSEDQSKKTIRVIIYGAGSAGRQLSIALTQSADYKTVAFIDNNPALLGQSIHGIKVVPRDDLGFLIKTKNVTEVLLAIPSLSRVQRNQIIHFLEPYALLVRSLPSVSELAQGKLRVADLREVSIKDLLGRDPVAANSELLDLNIVNKVVMVTGAGGSIGAELCRQILALKPQVLVLFDQSEFALYQIHQELEDVGMPNAEILPLLGSVTNLKRLSHILQRFDVNTIYHAAAYKHVPMVESNNTEGVRNNVFGTFTCAQAAIDYGVDTFVLVSTDKAVRPTNTMGATKRVAELVLQSLAVGSSTRFSMVRFGNVLDSSGSVVPLFREQIKGGGPVTVTDPEIQRYFMSIPEAVELVIQAGAMAQGGDVFVLDMGEPVRILDLAQKMIHLSGLRLKDKLYPEGDIEIKFTGLRPGEKLYEELLIGGNVSKTDNPMIMRAEEEMLAWDDLKLILEGLKESVDSGDQAKLRQILVKAVPGFKPQSNITDILYEA